MLSLLSWLFYSWFWCWMTSYRFSKAVRGRLESLSRKLCLRGLIINNLLKFILMLLLIIIITVDVQAQDFQILEAVLKPNDLPKFANPVQLFSVSAPDYYTGSYRHTIPINVPPSRSGLIPSVTLEYDSNGEDGFLGKGWNISIEKINRSLRKGVPEYKGPGEYDEDEFIYEIAGENGVLVFIRETTNGLLYRPKNERSLFAKFYYQKSNDTWTVKTRDGVTRILGGFGALDDSDFHMFAWNVNKIIDAEGYFIDYEYDSEEGTLYLQCIEYDLHDSYPLSNPPKIEFNWLSEPSINHRISYKKGFRSIINARKLLNIKTTGWDEAGKQQSRLYTLKYDKIANSKIESLSEFAPQDLPSTRFSYNAASTYLSQVKQFADPEITGIYNFGEEQQSLRYTKVTDDKNRTISMVTDVDGDGDLDQIYVRSHYEYLQYTGNQWYWRENIGDQWGKERKITLPLGCTIEPSGDYGFHPDALVWEHKRKNKGVIQRYQTLMDMNGDGAVDLVYVQQVALPGGKYQYQIIVCKATGIPNQITYGPNKVYYSEEQPTSGPGLDLYYNSLVYCQTPIYYYLTFGRDIRDLIDMNGDAIPDFVEAKLGFLNVRILDGSGKYKEEKHFLPKYNGNAYSAIRYEVSYGIGTFQSSWLLQSLFDMNGDSRIDLMLGPSIFFGTGKGFDLKNPYFFAAGLNCRSLSGKTSDTQTLQVLQFPGFHDMNGDGFIDDIDTGKWWNEIIKNCPEDIKPFLPLLGNSLSYYTNINSNNHDLILKQALMDFDGDGQIDIVQIRDTGINTPYYIYKTDFNTNGGPPLKLKSIETDNGFETSVSYDRPKQINSRTPLPLWPVSSTKISDKVTNKFRDNTIESQDPKYDALQGEFFGYQTVNITDEEKKISHYYLQDEYCRGLEFKTEIYKLPGENEANLLKKTGTQFEWISMEDDPNNIRLWARPKKITTTIYDSNLGWTTEDISTYHDGLFEGCDGGQAGRRLGLIATKSSGPPNKPTRKDAYEYICTDNDGIYIVRQSKQERSEISGSVEERTSWLYDDQCKNSFAPLIQGKVCEKKVFRGVNTNGQDFPEAITKFEYDNLGRTSQVTDPDGHITKYEYWGDTPFRKKEIRAPNTLAHTTYFSDYQPHTGEPGKICGPQFIKNVETDKCDYTKYDLWGRPTEIWLALDNSQGSYTQVKVRTYEYQDFYDQKTPGKIPYFKTIEYPDPLNQEPGLEPQRERIAYLDGWGNVIQEVDSYSGGYAKNYFEYDKQNQLEKAWQTINLPNQNYEPFNVQESYLYDYDVIGRLISIQNPAQKSKKIIYQSPRVDLLDELNQKTSFKINEFGEIVEVWKTANGLDLKRSFEYDAAGRITKAIDEEGGEYNYNYYKDGKVWTAALPMASYKYDRLPSGKISYVYKGDGNFVFYLYDVLGRILFRHVESSLGQSQAGDNNNEFFIYDLTNKEKGNLNAIWSTQYAQAFEHDALGNIIGKWLYDFKNSTMLWYKKHFNALGDEVEVTYPSGHKLNKFYDDAGRLIRVTDSEGLFKADEFSYEPDGLVKAFELTMTSVNNGMNTIFSRSFDYDEVILGKVRRLKSIKLVTGTNIHETKYTYYDNNLLESMSDPSRSNLNYHWYYDTANRLQHAIGYPGLANQELKYDYYKNGLLKSITSNGITTSFSRSNNNQILTQMIEFKPTGEITGNWNYTFTPKSGELCKVVHLKTAIDNTREYSWTGDGKLASMKQVGGIDPFETKYYYDYNGSRWRREHQGVTSLYLDGLVEQEVGKVRLEYISLPYTKCSLSIQGNVPAKCYFNDLMNVAYVYQDDGTLLQTNSYYPYGKHISVSGVPTRAEFDFNNHRAEPHGDLVYYGARYYDPISRQWLSIDPLRMEGVNDVFDGLNSMQPYVYASANPTSYTDPYGLDISDQGLSWFKWLLLEYGKGHNFTLGGLSRQTLALGLRETGHYNLQLGVETVSFGYTIKTLSSASLPTVSYILVPFVAGYSFGQTYDRVFGTSEAIYNDLMYLSAHTERVSHWKGTFMNLVKEIGGPYHDYMLNFGYYLSRTPDPWQGFTLHYDESVKYRQGVEYLEGIIQQRKYMESLNNRWYTYVYGSYYPLTLPECNKSYWFQYTLPIHY